jgi:hypothetical protein
MTNVWRNKNITLRTKVVFYKAFCLNTILWGCESIIISAEIEHKLETFQHKAIRFILNINMHQVKDERMRNEKVRAMFGNIDKVCDFATRRRLDFIGHTFRQDDKKLTKRLLTCWIRRARASGGQQLSLKDANFNAINSLLKSNNLPVEKNCPTSSWAKEALDPSRWKALVSKTKYIRPKRKTRKVNEETNSTTAEEQLEPMESDERQVLGSQATRPSRNWSPSERPPSPPPLPPPPESELTQRPSGPAPDWRPMPMLTPIETELQLQY